MNLGWLALISVAVYLVVVKCIAYFAYKKTRGSVEDYFVVNRSLGRIFIAATVVATMVNTLAVSGVPALVYKGGILYAQMFVIAIVAPLLIYWFGPKIWRAGKQHAVFTQGELFGLFYRSKAILILTALIGLLAIFPFATIQVSAIAKLFAVATNNMVTYEWSIALVAVSVGVYLFFGGSRAVVWTDLFQGLAFFLGLIIATFLFVKWAGGYAQGVENLKLAIPEKLSFNTHNGRIFLDNILSWPFAFFLWPQIFQRMFMAKSEQEIVRSIPYATAFFVLTVFCTMTLGIMATSVLHGRLADPDQMLAVMFSEFLPIGGVMLVVLVFATGMSTIDSILLTSSSIATRDLYVKGANQSLSQTTELNLSRGLALFFLLLICAFALSEAGRGAIAPLVTFGASFATLLLWPLIGVFYFKRAHTTAVLASMLFGMGAILCSHLFKWSAHIWIGPATLGFLVAGSLFFMLSFWLKSESNNNVL